MLPLPYRPGPAVRSLRYWKTASPEEAAGLIRPGATVAVGWIGDGLASAAAKSFRLSTKPSGLTVVYAVTGGLDRRRGLNLLAHEGLIRRVIGGQWHPVPGLHDLAMADRIEAYSLPAALINRLFRDTAEGISTHVTRVGLGSFTDPRRGGGRLNRRTREDIVHLLQAAGGAALAIRTFPIDVGLIGVGFMAETGAIAMTRDSMTIARAVHRTGGIVIAQPDHVGTLARLRPGHVEVPDTLVDILVADDRDLSGFARLPFLGRPPLARARPEP
jgi:propionate CoA-transferase